MEPVNVQESLERVGWTPDATADGIPGLCAPGDTGPDRLVLSLRQAWVVQCWHEDTDDDYRPTVSALDAWLKTWAGRACLRQFRKLSTFPN